MSVPSFTLEPTAADSVALNERMGRGGVVAAHLESAVPGQFWLLPRDAQRRYVGFTLQPGFGPCTITPGDDNAPAGFWLTAGTDPVEFGGASQLAIVQSEWWITASAAVALDVVVFRDN